MDGKSPKGAERSPPAGRITATLPQIGFAPDWTKRDRAASFKRNDQLFEVLPVSELGRGTGGPRSPHSASCPDCLGEPCCLGVINIASYCSVSYSFNGFIDGQKRDKETLSRNDRLPDPVFHFAALT